MIETGYCVIVRDFYARCVPFETVSVHYEKNTIPWYRIKLPNGEIEEFNEPDLSHSKEEIEQICEGLNGKMKEGRELLEKMKPKIARLEAIKNGR